MIVGDSMNRQLFGALATELYMWRAGDGEEKFRTLSPLLSLPLLIVLFTFRAHKHP